MDSPKPNDDHFTPGNLPPSILALQFLPSLRSRSLLRSSELRDLSNGGLVDDASSSSESRVPWRHVAPLGPPRSGAGELAPLLPFFFRVSWNGISSGSSSSGSFHEM